MTPSPPIRGLFARGYVGNFATLYERLGFMARNVRDMNTRARYLREAGLVGRSSRDLNAPDFDSVHAAIALLSCISAEAQIDAPAIVLRLWHLRWVARQPRAVHQSGIIETSPVVAVPSSINMLFGPQLVQAIDAAAADILPEEYEGIVVWRGGNLAKATSYGQANIFGILNGDDQGKAFLVTVTSAPRALIQELGCMVRQNREEALRRGIKINVEDAYQALGDAIPSYQLALPFASTEPGGASPESKTAATNPNPLPGTDTDAAVAIDQPVSTKLDGSSQAQSRDEREKSQPSSEAQSGHSHQHTWSDPHDEPRDGGAFCAAA